MPRLKVLNFGKIKLTEIYTVNLQGRRRGNSMKRTKFRIRRGDRERPMVTRVSTSEFNVTIVSNV